MPIYCLNSTKYASRKRSKNTFIHEVIGDNNYYLSSENWGQGQLHYHNNTHPHYYHNLSMASYHILMSRQQQQLCKSSSTSSLMVTIDRFKEAVNNMKQTVLVPTMLDALVGGNVGGGADDQLHHHHCYNPANSPTNHNYSHQLHTSSILEEDEVETDSACSTGDHCSSSSNDSGNEGSSGGGPNARPKSSLSWTSMPQQQNLQDDQTLAMTTVQNQQPLTMAASLSQHNLYEQYKLLDMIDSILSSDITLMNSKRHQQLQLQPLFSSSSTSSVYLNFPAEGSNDDNNNSCPAVNKHHQCCLQMLKTGGNLGQQMEESPAEGLHGVNGEYPNQYQGRGGHHLAKPATNGHRSALLGGKLDSPLSATTNSHLQEGVKSSLEVGETFVTPSDCSLLKIKEKLEYHLVSLKSILNLLSNTADCITSSYLEGIQCEDHFDSRQLTGKGHQTSGEQMDFQSSSPGVNNNRHYYTSN